MASNRRPQTNRRTVLKSVTAGTGTVLATTASVIGSAGNRVEVVMEWQGSEPYVTRKVPRKWKQHMDKTKRLAKELTDRYRANEDVYGFRRVRGDLNRGGKSAPQLGVRVREGSGVKSSLPNERKGVPIEVQEVENNQPAALTNRVGELVQQDTLVEQMGTTTGGTLGEIQADSEDVTIDCLDMKNKGFQCGANVSPGDSGGPVYRPTEAWDGLTMIGLASGTRRNKFDTVGTACNGNSIYTSFFGPPAWDMANHWNLNFSS